MERMYEERHPDSRVLECVWRARATRARTVAPTVPVTVTYEMTDLGLSLQRVMRDGKAWAEGHMDEVLTHRDRHDRLEDGGGK